MNIVDAVIAGKLSGGPSGPITPGSIVNATESMTPIQQAQTAQNLGVANDISSLGQEMYNKEIISSTADALFPLTASSGIYANTGVNTTSNKYCRSGFHYAASRMLILGLEEYEWCSWCYSSNQWGTQTHSNTNGEYISGLNAIYVAPQSGDNRYVVSFRRVDGATLTTDTSDPTSDFYKIQHAFRVFECQIDNVITNVAYQNEYTYNYGLDIAKKYGTFETATKNGVTFSWAGERCHVSGTSTSQATYTIYDSRTSLPPELNPGDWLMMDYQPSVETVKLRYYIAFWKSGDTSDPVFSKLDMIPRGFVVPDNAVGITLQIRVPSSTTIDRYVNKIRLVKVRPQYTEPRLLVSFVDDDTSGLTYVQRYHDACRHNGIFGNYAVLTTYPEQSQTMKETLLGYEDEGFGTLIHAYRQSSDDPWQTMGSDESKIEQCRAVLAKGLRQMRDMGFANYNYWVSPYGIKGPQAVRIAKDLGVECLISTNNFRHNDMMAYNPYYIKRVALRQDDNGDPDLKNTLADVKAAIDAAAASTSGAWLIITTHFNEWGDLTWDDTTDENGYPVGYARFNEMVQYAINAGLTPVTVPEGWTLYKPILTANKNLIDHAGATTSGQTNGAIIGGGNKNVSANEIVAATNRMTPAQAAQTVQNLGVVECNAENIVIATGDMTAEQKAATRQNIGADTPETVAAWLDEHVDPDTGYVIDNSLTVEGSAADAKATGDAVGELQSALEAITVGSKNLYNKITNLKNKIMGSTGSITDYSGYQVSDKIPVTAGEKYFISVYPTNAVGPRRVGLFGDNDALVRMIDQSYSSQVITIDSGVSYLRITGSDNTMANNKIQVEHCDHQTYYVNGYRKPEFKNSIIQITDDLYCGNIDFLEQGTFSSGVPSVSNARVRTSRLMDWRFTLILNPGYRIRQIERYNRATGTFVDETILTSVVTEYTNNGEYAVRLVFCKTDPNASVAYTENIIASIAGGIAYFRAMYDSVSSDLYVNAELEQGTIDSSGVDGISTNRVRFKNSIKNAFHLTANSNYVIRFVVLYDKTTGAHISTMTTRDTEYTSFGEYAVRLVFAYSDLETAITPNDDIIKSVDNSLETTTQIAAAGHAEHCMLITLPDPKTRQLARVDVPYGLLWSDDFCWRKSSDNMLAVSSTAYKTIKASDGSEVTSNNKTQINQCYSMTKLLTAVLLEENVNDLSQTITVNSTDVGSQTPIATEMHEGDIASYEVMLNCSLIYSDNIATDCIGRNVGYVLNPSAADDSEAIAAFFAAMSAKATALGMENTSNYVSPHGQMRSTPEDMCKLFKYIQANCPVIKSIWGKLNYTVTVTGTNPRSWDITSTTDAIDREILPEFVGGKTGSSDVLGTYGFVWESDTDDVKYITVLMNSPIANRERFYNARQILNEAYSKGV